MESIIQTVKKYWFLVSILFTIISSIVTGLCWFYGKIDALNDKVNDTNQWVEDHDAAIQAQHDDIVRLKEDERLRELFEFKRK